MMQENYLNDEIEIDLAELLGLMLTKAWILILCTLLFGGVAFSFSRYIVTPQYESTTSIYILNKETNNTITYSDAQLAAQLTKDYENLIKGRTVLEQVMDEFGISDESYESFAGKIKVSNPSDTRIIAITVKDADPNLARQMADRIREVAAEHIQSVTDVAAVNVADVANLPLEPSEPSILKWTAIGAMLGFVFCAAIIIIRHLLDDTIKSSEDVEKYLGLSTLAIIPVAEGMEQKNTKRKQSKIANPEEERIVEVVNTGGGSHGYTDRVRYAEDIQMIDLDEVENKHA